MIIRFFALALIYVLLCVLFLFVWAMSMRYLTTDYGMIAANGAIYVGLFVLGYVCGRRL